MDKEHPVAQAFGHAVGAQVISWALLSFGWDIRHLGEGDFLLLIDAAIYLAVWLISDLLPEPVFWMLTCGAAALIITGSIPVAIGSGCVAFLIAWSEPSLS